MRMKKRDPREKILELLARAHEPSGSYFSDRDWCFMMLVCRHWQHTIDALVFARRSTLFTSAICERHLIPKRSERPQRLQVIMTRCAQRFPTIRVTTDLPFATPAQLARFHTEMHVDTIIRLGKKIEKSMEALDAHVKHRSSREQHLVQKNGLKTMAMEQNGRNHHNQSKEMSKEAFYAQFEYIELDEDTSMMRHTLDASMIAAGGVCHAIDQVMAGDIQNAFCVVRPPGHHAEPQKSMGFCIFNNVGVGAFHALDHHGLSRVAIIDFDVHHGNGTQKRVQSEPRILYASLHQAPLYPGTGFAHECGEYNNILNVPLKARTNSKTYRQLFLDKVWPRIQSFQPELLLVSAGFDAHTHDPLADIRLVANDYYWITNEITKMAWECGHGRVVSVLEGGYHTRALADSAEQHVLALVHGSISTV